MTRTELNDLLSNTDKEFDYSTHEQLVHLTCVFGMMDDMEDQWFGINQYRKVEINETE